jgi:hypothetical protein
MLKTVWGQKGQNSSLGILQELLGEPDCKSISALEPIQAIDTTSLVLEAAKS